MNTILRKTSVIVSFIHLIFLRLSLEKPDTFSDHLAITVVGKPAYHLLSDEPEAEIRIN